jgi:predicted Zn-dependent protease
LGLVIYLDVRHLGVVLIDKSVSDLIRRAKASGANAATVSLYTHLEHVVTTLQGEVSPVTHHESMSRVLTVWVGEGQSAELIDSGLSVSDEALAELIARAHGAPVGWMTNKHEVQSKSGQLGIMDPRYGRLKDTSRIEFVVDVERQASKVDARVKTGLFSFSDTYTQRLWVSSFGTIRQEESTVFRGSGSVLFAENDVIHEVVESRQLATLYSLPFGVKIARRAAALLGPTQQLNGSVRVVLPSWLSAKLFGRIAAVFGRPDPMLSFVQLIKNGGPQQFSPHFHLLDDGGLNGGLRTTSFDHCGVRPIVTSLIRDGQMIGRYQPIGDGLSPTGHATMAGLRPSNLTMRCGTRSVGAILNDHPELPVLVLDTATGFDKIDLDSGEVNLVGHGQLRRASETLGPVRNVKLRGNLCVLLNSLVTLASNMDRVGHVDAPAMMLDGFTASH